MATKKKPAKRVAKKGPKRAARTSKAAKTTRKASSASGPTAVKTGRGPSPMEIATEVFSMLKDGKFTEVEERWLAPSIVSVEGAGVSMAWTGKKAVLGKYRGWESDNEINEMRVEGPWVGATGFAVRYVGDITQKSTGQRNKMEEIAVYTVKDGKIVREEFHFATGA
jgi:hypothetical protein